MKAAPIPQWLQPETHQAILALIGFGRHISPSKQYPYVFISQKQIFALYSESDGSEELEEYWNIWSVWKMNEEEKCETD